MKSQVNIFRFSLGKDEQLLKYVLKLQIIFCVATELLKTAMGLSSTGVFDTLADEKALSNAI